MGTMFSTGLEPLVEKVAAQREKVAIDPVSLAGMIALGKIGLTNTFGRHAAKIPPLRWLGKEIAGVGARTGMQGRPMLSKPTRELTSFFMDPKLTGLYEDAHTLGRYAGPSGAEALRQGANKLKGVKGLPSPVADAAKFVGERVHAPAAGQAAAPHVMDAAKGALGHLEGLPHMSKKVTEAAKFIESVPLESKGARKVVDYGFTPVKQVARDIGGGIKSLARRASKRMYMPPSGVPAAPPPGPPPGSPDALNVVHTQ